MTRYVEQFGPMERCAWNTQLCNALAEFEALWTGAPEVWRVRCGEDTAALIDRVRSVLPVLVSLT